MKLLRVGFGNAVVAERIRQILGLRTASERRWLQEADQIGKLIDATAGRQSRSLIITDSGHVVVSAISPDLLRQNLEQL